MGREESNRVAEEGTGYALGIVGLSCMCALLLYSVRKRARFLRGVGRISTWFQIHMILGLVGPVAILYHCNFQLGSLNSNVALACALVVAASGVVGRVIYTRIHHGLSDRRATVEEMRSEVERARDSIAGGAELGELWNVLADLERKANSTEAGPGSKVLSLLLLGHRCRRARRRGLRSLRRAASRHPEVAVVRKNLGSALKRYVAAVRRAESVAAYERVFGLWHVLHLPLAFLLYASAAIHVVAVNMY